ncbi:hypothetical protein OKW26_003645 [Paraburkholderia sp. 32]
MPRFDSIAGQPVPEGRTNDLLCCVSALEAGAAFLPATFDLHHEHVPGPAYSKDLAAHHSRAFDAFKLIHQRDHTRPGQLCDGVLHEFLARPGFGQRTHVLQVSRRKPAHVRKRRAEIGRQLIDDLCAPPLSPLPLEDLAAYL